MSRAVVVWLLVGGTLFFEFVVPIAIEDLKREQQLAVFGKARWVFRRVVWVCAVILLLSGAVSLVRLWGAYELPRYRGSVPWAVGHVTAGIAALGIALLLTVPARPPSHPVGWMRANLAGLVRPVGKGMTEPVAPNTNPDGSDNPAGRASNRRVDIEFDVI